MKRKILKGVEEWKIREKFLHAYFTHCRQPEPEVTADSGLTILADVIDALYEL